MDLFIVRDNSLKSINKAQTLYIDGELAIQSNSITLDEFLNYFGADERVDININIERYNGTTFIKSVYDEEAMKIIDDWDIKYETFPPTLEEFMSC
jgi:hypothetical protein